MDIIDIASQNALSWASEWVGTDDPADRDRRIEDAVASYWQGAAEICELLGFDIEAAALLKFNVLAVHKADVGVAV